jgi:hypothetical protein
MIVQVWGNAPESIQQTVMAFLGGLERVHKFKHLERLLVNTESSLRIRGGVKQESRKKRPASPAIGPTRQGSNKRHRYTPNLQQPPTPSRINLEKGRNRD